MWATEKLTPEQAIGQILLQIEALSKRIGRLEREQERKRRADLAEGAKVKEILADFPTLTDQDVWALIAFAAASAEEDLPLPTVPTPP